MPQERLNLASIRRVGVSLALAGALAGTAIGVDAAVSGSSLDAGAAPQLAAAHTSSGNSTGTAVASGSSGTSGPSGPFVGKPGIQLRTPKLVISIAAVGSVSDASASGFTLTTPSGQSRSVVTSSSTAYDEAGTEPGGVSDGELVAVATKQAPPTSTSAAIDASRVLIIGPEVRGTVIALSNGTATIQDSEGFYHSVEVASATVTTPKSSTTTLAVGDHVVALGTIASDHTTLDATDVVVLPAKLPAGPLGIGALGPGPFGLGSLGIGPLGLGRLIAPQATNRLIAPQATKVAAS